MRPLLAACSVLLIGVAYIVYVILPTRAPQNAGGHCQTNGCNYHHDHCSMQQSNGSSNEHARYDTLPNFRQRPNADEDDNVCPICQEFLYTEPQHTLPCRHRMHSECFRKLRLQSNSCPICRHEL